MKNPKNFILVFFFSAMSAFLCRVMARRNVLKNSWIKILVAIFSLAFVLIIAGISAAYIHQDHLVKKSLAVLNQDFQGQFTIKGSHISPFVNFPYISIDLEEVAIYETKAATENPLIKVSDAYVGFDLWSVINGSFEVKKVKLRNGTVKLVQYRNGDFNIEKAFVAATKDTTKSPEGAFQINLKGIEMENIDMLKLNESNGILVESYIKKAQSSFKATEGDFLVFLDTEFVFNLIMEKDTSFLHDKSVELHTTIHYDLKNNFLDIDTSEIVVEKASFKMAGAVNIEDNMNLDLFFRGEKANFDLFFAFVPPEITPILERYDNGGHIYFNATVNGPSIKGNIPKVEIDFGCSEAYFNNTNAGKAVNDLYFRGHFTTGELNDPTTMELSIEDFSAKPETGTFSASISVKNFETPDIRLQLNSDFNVDFLADFLEIDNLENTSGKVSFEMNFHDIIDLDAPEKSIEQLNQSYFTRINIENLNFTSTGFPLPFKDINLKATMEGHEAVIEWFQLNVGGSDLALDARISDLPAIIHHTDIPVEMSFNMRSSLLDLYELTKGNGDSTAIREQIKDLSLALQFVSSARAFTESPNLPIGEFFIKELHATMTNYPHELHDFNADIFIDTVDFRVVDFTGMIDQSDFHFNGKLNNYDLWFEEKPKGLTTIDFDFRSDKLQLDDLFSYGGENYVPEDYRKEEFQNLKIHAASTLEFEEKLQSATLSIKEVNARMKVHKMEFKEFNGEFFMDSTQLLVKNFGGKLGNSDFKTNLVYHRKADSTGEFHSFDMKANRLDFDQLFSYQPPPPDKEMTPQDHESGFNIFEVPFSNLHFDFDIDHLNYHRYLIDDFKLKGRTQTNHYVYIDTMALKAAGGQIGLKGYFNGSNPDAIYFSPTMTVKQVDLDQLLFKFENFGQDQLLSDNLKGQLSGAITGKVHMHADMVPIIDDSELHIEIEVVNGRLVNYPAFNALSGYFADKNLSNVRFDTLRNTLDLKDGTLTIPNMNINTTLGFFEISGKQSLDQNMEYYVRIPLRVIAKAGLQKLFGNKKRENPEQEDEIQYRDESKRIRFLNLKITGTPDNYDISLGKEETT